MYLQSIEFLLFQSGYLDETFDWEQLGNLGN